jgi:hypothetical protein
VTVQWLDTGVSIAAAADLAFALVNCGWLIVYACAARTAARRAGSAALALVNASMAMEAALFLSTASVMDGPAARTVAVVVLRGVLLGSSSLMALLLLRSPGLR